MTWIWLVWVLCLFFFLAGYLFGCLIGRNHAVDAYEEPQKRKTH